MDHRSDNGFKGEIMNGQSFAETFLDDTSFWEDSRENNISVAKSKLQIKNADLFKKSQEYQFKVSNDTVPRENKSEKTNQSSTSLKYGYSFSILQEWEGYVVSISKDTFTARLVDVTKGSIMEDEEADFLLSDLGDSDRVKICIGAIFRWIVGYRRSPGGTIDRSSRIKFRDLPGWTERELEKNRQDAIEWANALNKE
jgi:hypothetical protein